MARSRYDIEINGDNRGLTVAVNKSMDELNKLNNLAGGLFSNLSGPLGNLQNGLNTINSMNPALRSLGAAGLVAGAGLMAINKASEIVGTLNQISTNTGVTVETLQKLQQEFKTTGIEAEKFGDMNKDALDKLGDSIRAGGGVADDLKEWGINLKEYTKYAGDAEGGIKAIIDTFYKLKTAGKSHAEITNAMETMASDSSHLITTLEKYNSTADALNAINKQSASITNDTAREFQEYEKNVKTLQTNIDNLTVQAVGPLIKEVNELWSVFNKDWTKSEIFDGLKQFWYGGDTAFAKLNRWVDNIGDEGYSEASKAEKKQIEDFLARNKEAGDKAFEQRKQQESANETIRQRELKEQKDANTKAEAEAKRKHQEEQRRIQEAIKLRKQYISTISSLASLGIQNDIFSSNKVSSNLDSSRAAGIKDSIVQLGVMKSLIADFKNMDTGDFASSLESAKSINDQQMQMLSQSLSAGKITLKEYNAEIEKLKNDLNVFQQAYQSSAQQDHSLDGEKDLQSIGWANQEEQQALQKQALDEQNRQFQLANEQRYTAGIISHDQFLAQKERLDQAYANKSDAIARQSSLAQIQIANDLASGLAGTMQGILGENNKAAQAMFAVSKGISIANGIMNAYEASTKAMAMYPGPLGYAMAAGSYAKVIGEVMSMKSVTLGQFHDGIDNVPNTGTYLLQEGERVVDNRLNDDLTKYLSKQEQTPSGQGPIDASIHINGNVTDQRWFTEQLKKQKQAIATLVQDANRRRQ